MTIRAAIIGMGIGQKHFEAIENYKGSKVKVICEKNKKKIFFLKKKFPNKIITSNENDIFLEKRINLVSIASYDNHHYRHILKCIKYNKNIIVEKPMCLNLNQLKKINNLLKQKKKIKITSNLVLRVNSLFKQFKEKINNKKIYYIEADYLWGRKNKLFGWRSNVRDYSLILGAGIHMIDLIVWLTGLKPKTVYALGNNKATKGTKFKKNSFVVMIFEFPMNILVKITANGAAVHNHFHEIKIFSKDNTIINSEFGSYIFKKKKFLKINSSYPDKTGRKKLIRNFLDILNKKNTKPIISLREQLNLMSICLSAERSIKLNKKIKINYF
jgi:predicted dehydrogenase